MFQLKKNYTGEKEFSLRLRQLDGSVPKNFSNKVSICFAIRPKKSFKKRKMITWLLIHLLLEAFKVQTIYLDIGKSSEFNDFFTKYPNTRFIYRFQLISITLSTNITNTDGEILIMCKGFKDAKKCDTKGEEDTIYGIIHTENIENWKVVYNI